MTDKPGWLRALDQRIEREILRLRARYELSLDEFRGLYVSDEQVDAIVAGRGAAAAEPPSATDRPMSAFQDTDGRWRRLVDAFGLSALDQDLLLIAAAPEIDVHYETLYAYLNNDVTRTWPTADLACRLLVDVESSGGILRALSPGGTLERGALVVRLERPKGRPAILNGGYALHPCVTYWLQGDSPALALDRSVVAWSEAAGVQLDAAARARAEPLRQLLERWSPERGSLPVVALEGQPGSGRRSTAAAAAAAAGRPLVRVDLRALDDSRTDAADILGAIKVALTLVPAVVLLDGVAGLGANDERRPAEARLVRATADWPASTLIAIRTAPGEGWRALTSGRRVLEVRCAVESYDARVSLWTEAARDENVALSDADLHGLAGRFALTPGRVREALATARDLAAMHGAPAAGAGDIAAAARLGSDQTLGRLAVKIERKHAWHDLVLPPSTLRRLQELAGAVRHRHVVYSAWGFGERIITGTGIKALFAGASGTGKTMAAGVIARELGLDLYKVDLSGVVSKYIGETEKNLDKIFRAARSSNAIVFLDEADALMGKRSEVKDAHDRYANIEVAYLLQQLEDHDGVVILATNLKRNIDDAFSRRVQYVIDFPRPEPEERERIWRQMFPGRAPLAADVDFNFLARQFDLAGGDIRNVVMDAAFVAAEETAPIDMRALVEALARQLAKQGKTPTGTDFRQYQRLLATPGIRHDGR